MKSMMLVSIFEPDLSRRLGLALRRLFARPAEELQSKGRCFYALCCFEFYPSSRASFNSAKQPEHITLFPITAPAQPSSSSSYMHSSPQKIHGLVIFSPFPPQNHFSRLQFEHHLIPLFPFERVN